MDWKKFFKPKLIHFIIDITIFSIGLILSQGGVTYCRCAANTTCSCPQSSLLYIGLALLLISVIYFIILIVAFLSNKFKK